MNQSTCLESALLTTLSHHFQFQPLFHLNITTSISPYHIIPPSISHSNTKLTVKILFIFMHTTSSQPFSSILETTIYTSSFAYCSLLFPKFPPSTTIQTLLHFILQHNSPSTFHFTAAWHSPSFISSQFTHNNLHLVHHFSTINSIFTSNLHTTLRKHFWPITYNTSLTTVDILTTNLISYFLITPSNHPFRWVRFIFLRFRQHLHNSGSDTHSFKNNHTNSNSFPLFIVISSDMSINTKTEPPRQTHITNNTREKQHP